MWIMSTNPVVSMPDADRVRGALERCELVVVSDCVRETDTTACAHVLLPAAAWGEKDGTVTNSERRISRQRPFLPEPGESRADWWIVTEVARRMGFGAAVRLSQRRGRSSASTRGFRRSRTTARARSTSARSPRSATRSTTRSSRSSGRDAMRAATRDRTVAAVRRRPLLHAQRQGAVRRDARRARRAHRPSADYPLVLNTGRIRDQWHTMTRTGTLGAADGPPPGAVRASALRSTRSASASRPAISRKCAARSARIVVRVEISDAVVPRARVRADALERAVREPRARRRVDRRPPPIRSRDNRSSSTRP